MAETLGSLCDKLGIVTLKQWHTDAAEKQVSLSRQARLLKEEIDDLMTDACCGAVDPARLKFDANKVYDKTNFELTELSGTIGDLVGELARINCELWHAQEHIFEFDAVPVDEKDSVVKKVAGLNLERTQCIDAIDSRFVVLLTSDR